MTWVLAGLAGVVVYFFGKNRGWWSGAPKTFTCDLETDMPDQLRQAVLAQLATSKDPVALNQLAATMLMGRYEQAAYCLRHRAWQLQGSQGTPPPAPSAADLALAAQVRAQNRAASATPGAPPIAAAPPAPAQKTGVTPADVMRAASGYGGYNDDAVHGEVQ